MREQYKGPLYAEVSPRTFSVLVRKGSRLSQLRIRRGNPPSTDEDDAAAAAGVSGRRLAINEEDIRNGVPVSVDVRGERYRRPHRLPGEEPRRADRYRPGRVTTTPRDFWEPVHAPRRGGLMLDPAEFYILASREPVKVPPTHAAEMIAYDTLVGEFRVHYAGFFDPGFGHPDAGGEGARAVLEVRSYEVPFVHRARPDRRAAALRAPHRAARTSSTAHGVNSSYQRQGIALSKHFKATYEAPP